MRDLFVGIAAVAALLGGAASALAAQPAQLIFGVDGANDTP